MKGLQNKEYYVKELTDIFTSINDVEFLLFVYKFVNRLKENWGV